MDRARVQIVKVMHRPVLDWIGCRIRSGCCCGDAMYPCPTLVLALEAEERQVASVGNVGRFGA